MIPRSEGCKAKERILMKGLCLKRFKQNKALGKSLLRTKGKALHECTRDMTWTTGTALNSYATRNNQWGGGDLLGVVLSEVRQELVREPLADDVSNEAAATDDEDSDPDNSQDESIRRR